MYSFKLVFCVSSAIFPEVESPGHKAIPFLFYFLRNHSNREWTDSCQREKELEDRVKRWRD